jgi:hypothetical protein
VKDRLKDRTENEKPLKKLRLVLRSVLKMKKHKKKAKASLKDCTENETPEEQKQYIEVHAASQKKHLDK